MTRARDELLDALRAAMEEVSPGTTLQAAFETPRQAAHGDLACTAAMQLAKPLKRNPRQVAESLSLGPARNSAVSPMGRAAIDIAGPGFINLRLAAAGQAAGGAPRCWPRAQASARRPATRTAE